jgi:hypothetical protein
MKHLLNILNKLSLTIIKEQGDLSIFALSRLSDSDKWNLLIVADWCKSPSRDSFQYLYDAFKRVCDEYIKDKNKAEIDAEISEYLEFPFVILIKESSLADALKRKYTAKPTYLSPVAINAYSDKKIEEIYLFATDDKTDRSKFEFYEHGRFSEEFLDRV